MHDSRRRPHSIESPPRYTFAVSSTRRSPSPSRHRARLTDSPHHRLCHKWLSLRDNMSSCLNLRRAPTSPIAGASTNPSGGLSTSSEVSRKTHDEMHPQNENEPPCFEIGMPYDLKHEVHIHYNFKEARYEGVPDNFAEFLASGLQNSKKSSTASALSASFSSMTKPSQRIKRSRTGSNNSTGAANNSHCNSSNLPYNSKMDAELAACAGATDPQLLLNQHFKVHFRQVPRLVVPGYDDRIPAVLVMLQKHFMTKQGYLLPHIFRESPSKSDRDQAMREINTGTFSGASHDVRVLADLIKLWFRELPVPILHEIRADHMEKIIKMGGVDVADEVLGMLGPLERCIVLWLADLLAHVAGYQSQNHMGVDQLAIIIAPNLVRIETENPMLAVALSKAAVDVFRCVLRARFEARRQLSEDLNAATAAEVAEQTETLARAVAAEDGAAAVVVETTSVA